MNFSRAIVAAIVLFGLSGCVIKGPEVRVKPPIEVVTEPHSDGGGFCPPGQRKKGNC